MSLVAQRPPSFIRCDGGVPGSPHLTVIEDVSETYLQVPRPAFANGIRSFNANNFYCAPAIAGVVVVQHLTGREHDAASFRICIDVTPMHLENRCRDFRLMQVRRGGCLFYDGDRFGNNPGGERW